MIFNKNISIIVLIRGQSKYLNECISALSSLDSSVITPNLIFINDGAIKDDRNTFYDLIKKVNHQYSYYEWEQIGVEKSLNKILDTIDTDFFVRCDGDDILDGHYFNKLEKSIKLMIKDIDICGIAPSFEIIEEGSKPISYNYRDKFISQDFLVSSGDILATGMLLKVRAVKEVGMYQTEINNSGLESYELCLRLLSNKYKLLTNDSKLFSYRRHKGSTSINNNARISNNGHRINELYNLGRYTRGSDHPYNIL